MNLYKVVIADKANEHENIIYVASDSLEKIERRFGITKQGAIMQPNEIKKLELLGHVIIA